MEVVNMIGQGVMLTYVDMNSKNETIKFESTRLVNSVLPEVAKAIYRAMIVVYADNNNYGESRLQFGIKHHEVPAITFYGVGAGSMAYPIDMPQFKEEIVAYATKIVKGEIVPDEGLIAESINPEMVALLTKQIGEPLNKE